MIYNAYPFPFPPYPGGSPFCRPASNKYDHKDDVTLHDDRGYQRGELGEWIVQGGPVVELQSLDELEVAAEA